MLIFVIALSEYDLVCEEDNTTNRLDESLKLFEEMVNNKYFAKTNICIFYNKNDLFIEKVQQRFLACTSFESDTPQVPVHNFSKFHKYDGPNTADAVRKHICGCFESLNKSDAKQRAVYTHVTCATDTEQIKIVWTSVADVLLRENLASAGFSQEMI